MDFGEVRYLVVFVLTDGKREYSVLMDKIAVEDIYDIVGPLGLHVGASVLSTSREVIVTIGEN